MDIDTFADSLPIACFETDHDGRLTAANAAFRRLALGGAPFTVGVAPWVQARPAERARAEAVWVDAQRRGAPCHVEVRIVPLGGDPAHDDTWIAFDIQPATDGDATVRRWVGTAHDVTDAVRRRTVSDQLIGLLDTTADSVVVFDPQLRLTYANEAARDVLGIDAESSAGRAAAVDFIDAIRHQVPREIIDDPRQRRWEGEVGVRTPDGFLRTLAVTLQVVRDANGAVQHHAIVARDVTESKHLQNELQRQATHDALTGLPNRVLVLRRLAEALERDRTTKRGVTVLFIDIDRLKEVNDTIGHHVGDQLIVHIARRLVNATRPSDIVARISGDEFVVVAEGLGDAEVAMEVAERVRLGITGEVVLQGVDVLTGASVGVALSTPALVAELAPGDAAAALLSNADTAMYRAKQRGKGRCELYTEEMRTNARERVQLAAQLERALAADELFVVYQPLHSAQSSRVVGIEAYVRWRHPDRGVLTPANFLAVAVESGSIGPIGDWVLRTALDALVALCNEGIVERGCALHVNVAARQLGDAGFVERTIAALHAAGVEPHRLVFDIDETTLFDDVPGVVRTLNALRRHDVRLAIDDFGTGYSSLAHLRESPAQQLKLDGTFVRNIGRDGNDDPLVRSLIQLAHSIGMTVVAEWVSSADQLNRLRALGCDVVQGNHLCPAVTLDDLRRTLARTTPEGERR
ncbi:MAG: putative bifunctional diguanylate cyclase/phosphodiesterase [Ilumatobacteraceae bacterium]